MPSPRKVRRNRREEGGTDHRQKVTDGTNRSSVPPLVTNYQRLRPPPPPPLGRSVLGRASLTFNARPSSSRPLPAAIAFSASPSLAISTNPKPLGCPESRSVQMLTRSTVPWVSNRERTEASVTPKLRLPTNMFFMFTYP